MSASWLFTNYPSSRSIIENDVRLAFWKAGVKGIWVTCIKDTAPFECQADWNGTPLTFEWEPKNYLMLKMKSPNQDLLNAFERLLKHKALAAYKNGGGSVVVEWRVKSADTRFEELQAGGVTALERLDK